MIHGDRDRIRAEIEQLEAQAAQCPEEISSSVARYLCILASGFLEASCKDVLGRYARVRSDGTVARFVEHRLADFSNPNTEKILQLVGEFAPEKRVELAHRVSDQVKDCIDSIRSNRNNIAHGRRSDLTLARAKSYFQAAKGLMADLEQAFPPAKARKG